MHVECRWNASDVELVTPINPHFLTPMLFAVCAHFQPLHPPHTRTHTVVPNSAVVGCLGNSKQNVKAGELALRLHFEAEHSNVLLVTAELLNGCLTTCEVMYMDMALHQYDDKMVSWYVVLGKWSDKMY